MVHLKSAMDEFLLSVGFVTDKWLYNEESGDKVACVQYVHYGRKLIINHSFSFLALAEETEGDKKLSKLLPTYRVVRVVLQGHNDVDDLLQYLTSILEEE